MIDGCSINTQIQYNINTNYIKISTYYRYQNYEKTKNQRKQYYIDNKEKIINKIKQRYLNNKEKINEYLKQYYNNNQEKAIEYAKQYRIDNKEKISKQDKQRRIKNRDPNTLIFGSDEYRILCSCIKQGINRNEFDGFLTDQKYCSLFNEEFREKIRERFHRICYLCGKTESDNNRKLSVHHVNYNKNCLCGSICEFVSLCQSCHSKTNGSRQLWEDLIMGYLYPERYFMIDL